MGYWGSITANVDWCEANYEVTSYVAEFWNTVTSIVFMLIPLAALYRSWHDKHHEGYFRAAYATMALVGFGSAAFHCTLLKTSQLLDEIPMLWCSMTLVYIFFQRASPPGSHRYYVMIPLFAYVLICTTIYLYTDMHLLFLFAYGFSVVAILGCGVQSMREYGDSRINVYCYYAMLLYGLGFALWLTERFICSHLEYIRDVVPTAGFITQLHGWWHLLSATGTYLSINAFSLSVRAKILKRRHTRSANVLCILPYYRIS